MNNNEDNRVERILEQILNYTKFNFQERGAVSENGDGLDAIITGLNTLGQEINTKVFELNNTEKRMNQLIDILLKYTQMDFSEKIPLSDKGDELDAVSAGVNALVEELNYRNSKIIENEDKFNKAFHISPAGIVLASYPLGQYIEVNESFLKMTGYSRDEIIGHTALELNMVDPEERASILKEILQTGSSKNKELTYNKKSGEKLHTLFSNETMIVNGEKCFLTILYDITERKKIEEQLKESEERFRLLINDTKDYAIFMIDPAGFVKSWNKGAELIKGYTSEEISGKHISIFYTADEIERGEPEHNLKMAKENGRHETEGIRMRKNGATFWAEISITALYNPNGELKGFSKVTHDITARKKAEEKIKKTIGQLSQSQKMAHIGSWEWDITNNSISWSDELFRIYGLEPQQFIPSFGAANKFIHPDDKEYVEQITVSCYHEKKPFSVDHRITRMDGAIRIINEQAKTTEDASGNIVKMYGTIYDITEQKQKEAEIKQKSEELLRSNQELEQFAYVASHDLQEPLRMVTSYVQLLEKRYKDKLDEDANDFINFAVDGSNRMRTLINSLLEYSRVNRIKPFELINTNFLLEEILQNLISQIEENKAVIKCDELPSIYGDPVLIGQLFQNLITNAIKFKGEKKPEIIISCKKTKNELLFLVKDNGIGIPQEYAQKIFVIFQRLHNKEKYQGTGIGLAICKKIVERHGGKIWVESKINEGASFYFTIAER
jgi:PAS domain S-box-containing protein